LDGLSERLLSRSSFTRASPDMNTGGECSEGRELPLDSVRDISRKLEHLANLQVTHRRFAQLLGQTVHPSFVRWRLLLPGSGHVFLVISGHVVSTPGLDARPPCGDGAHTMRPSQGTPSRRTPARLAPGH